MSASKASGSASDSQGASPRGAARPDPGAVLQSWRPWSAAWSPTVPPAARQRRSWLRVRTASQRDRAGDQEHAGQRAEPAAGRTSRAVADPGQAGSTTATGWGAHGKTARASARPHGCGRGARHRRSRPRVLLSCPRRTLPHGRLLDRRVKPPGALGVTVAGSGRAGRATGGGATPHDQARIRAGSRGGGQTSTASSRRTSGCGSWGRAGRARRGQGRAEAGLGGDRLRAGRG